MLDIKLLKIMRNKIGTASATCYVGDEVASSGELKFMILGEGEEAEGEEG